MLTQRTYSIYLKNDQISKARRRKKGETVRSFKDVTRHAGLRRVSYSIGQKEEKEKFWKLSCNKSSVIVPLPWCRLQN